jgi:hypothetical protein
MCNKFITGCEFAGRTGIRASTAGESHVIRISIDLCELSCHVFFVVQSAFTSVPCKPLPAMSANPPALQRSVLSRQEGRDAKKRKSENTGLDEVEKTMYTTFCSAANFVTTLHSGPTSAEACISGRRAAWPGKQLVLLLRVCD